jgi:hypothetical protein
MDGDLVGGWIIILVAIFIVVWWALDERGKGPYWSPRSPRRRRK